MFVAALEPLDAARRVDDALLAGEEGVAVAAHLDPQQRLGRVGLPRVAAGAV